MRLSIPLLAAWLSVVALVGARSASGQAADRSVQNLLESTERPFLAIWRNSDGLESNSRPPYLRVAIWSDGRVLYAKDPSQWSHELRQGQISRARVARLKTALADSGVFALKGYCYLVPSAPRDCLMVELAGKQQMLYWDEIESPNYGININPKPHHLEFKRCWKGINHLALVALPDEGEAVDGRVEIPESWYFKPAIQSE